MSQTYIMKVKSSGKVYYIDKMNDSLKITEVNCITNKKFSIYIKLDIADKFIDAFKEIYEQINESNYDEIEPIIVDLKKYGK